MRLKPVVISGILSIAFLSHPAAQTPAQQQLQPPSSFQGIGDRAARSRAIFGELGKVLTHPRCMNCHPAGDHPLHDPPGEPARRASGRALRDSNLPRQAVVRPTIN